MANRGTKKDRRIVDHISAVTTIDSGGALNVRGIVDLDYIGAAEADNYDISGFIKNNAHIDFRGADEINAGCAANSCEGQSFRGC